jgi:hypothetical protein
LDPKQGLNMRFGFLVVAAAAVGILATVAIPSTFLQTSSTAVRSFVGGIKVADLNPFRAVFDYDQAQISAVHTPQSLGFKPTTVSIPSFPAQQPFGGLANSFGFHNEQPTNWQNPPH